MIWTTRLALSVLVVICSQSIFALGQSPWQSASMAESFMTYFSAALGQSGAFTNEQMDDIDTIATSIKMGVDKMERSGKTSQNKLQAMNMAFASAVAEIAIAEGGGQSAQVKTNAIADALASAFLQTTGVVNSQFINEIRGLISMFAQANSISSTSASASASAAVGTGGAGQGYGIGLGGQGGAAQGGAAAAAAGGQGGQGGLGSQGAGQGGYGAGQGGAGAAAAAAAAGGAGGAGRGGLGAGQGYGSGLGGQGGAGQGGAAAAAAAAGGQGGQGGYGGLGSQGAGQGGYGAGQGGAGAAAAAAAAGGAGGAGRGGLAVTRRIEPLRQVQPEDAARCRRQGGVGVQRSCQGGSREPAGSGGQGGAGAHGDKVHQGAGEEGYRRNWAAGCCSCSRRSWRGGREARCRTRIWIGLGGQGAGQGAHSQPQAAAGGQGARGYGGLVLRTGQGGYEPDKDGRLVRRELAVQPEELARQRGGLGQARMDRLGVKEDWSVAAGAQAVQQAEGGRRIG
ncbi:hypothetical protein HNY73_014705 [Argiope bruennichi]|uniref:Spidroin N-terminal domain-containing protein n=1 Tax=Argiope bruennichi TaxID=94029 RepID=A0A8T0EUA5_ARGBR|nr:hypothetical protein HNY73_014705 [Argiope bruennichi]